MLFRLIGNTTVFREVYRYKAAGSIPVVVGHTLDGRHQTVARLADIEVIADRPTNR